MLAGIGARERAGGPDGRAGPSQIQSPQRNAFAWLTKRGVRDRRERRESGRRTL